MNDYEYFSLESDPSLACGCCGSCHMDDNFMRRLDDLRRVLGYPLYISSGYRCPSHNANVSKTGATGPHTTGQAVDIAIDRERAYRLVGAATMLGFRGIGVKQAGDGRFIHLDTLEKGRPTIWSY